MNPTAAATADRAAVRLSDPVGATVTVVVRGPAPLVVNPPAELLTGEAAGAWKVQAAGNATLAEQGGAAEWTQRYTLSPYVPGDAWAIEFQPFTANGVAVTPPSLTLAAESTLKGVRPEDVRPVTGIEELPPPPPTVASPFGWFALGGLAVAAVAGLAGWLVRRARRVPPLSPDEWVTRQFADLSRTEPTGRAFADGLADAVRGYIQRRFGLAAERLTTVELLTAADVANVWTADTRAAVAGLLEACDRAKFAGDEPDTPTREAMLASAQAAVAGWK